MHVDGLVDKDVDPTCTPITTYARSIHGQHSQMYSPRTGLFDWGGYKKALKATVWSDRSCLCRTALELQHNAAGTCRKKANLLPI